MARYSLIAIIYNPKSTGPGRRRAEDLAEKLAKALPKQPIELIATASAGHAEELAYDLATGYKRPLIISVSGDGGYHEVINGIIHAQKEGANPIAGLLPAGNANDHFKNVHTGDFIKAIQNRDIHKIDLLRLTVSESDRTQQRYAHSYIGLGLTPKAARELNKASLNRWKEIWIVTKVVWNLQPVSILIGRQLRTYDSIIFTNISKMSKYFKIAKSAEPKDGKFDVSIFPHHGKLAILRSLIKATTTGLQETEQTKRYRFKTVRPELLQLDGEILNVGAEAAITITLERGKLHCIV